MMGRRTRRRASSLAVILVCGLTAGRAAGLEVRHIGRVVDGVVAPTAVVVGAGHIAALEPLHGELVVYSADGVALQKVATARGGAALAALDANRFLVGNPQAGAVDLIVPAAATRSTFIGGISDPRGLAVGTDEVFVLDAGRGEVVVADKEGARTSTISLDDPGLSEPSWFASLAWDPVRERLHLVDQTNATVVTYDRGGRVVASCGGFGTTDGGISRPGAVVCDADGWLFVADRYQGRVAVYDATGAFAAYVDPVDLGLDRLALPVGVAVDAEGFLYVAAAESAAIEIYHLDKSGGPVPQLMARAVSPDAGAPVAADRLRFVAGLQGPASAASGLAADFRLVARADTTRVLAAAQDVGAVEVAVTGNLVVATATWEPAFTATGGEEYGWQTRAVTPDTAGTWTGWNWFVPTAVRLPFRLDQNAPNPFNPRTVIRFRLAETGPARLRIVDVRGREVWSREVGDLGPGEHEILWRGEDNAGVAAASGVYFYRLEAGAFVQTRKMVLTR